MKKFYFLLLLIPFFGNSQFEIGETSIVFNDLERDREVETFIFYPATEAGEDATLASGEFPVIAVAHGFLMTYESYQYIWEHFVPLGYIVILPNTETTVAASHSDFAADLIFSIQSLQTENSLESSIFYEHVTMQSGIIGHSMGGGAAILAAAVNSSITTIITLAAAETDPSAIDATSETSQPTLTFAASNDCVAPPADHQEPIYANHLDCKGYILIEGGSHCQFANSNFICELGEFACPSVEISEDDQHTTVLSITTPWLAAYLKSDFAAWEELVSLVGDNPTYNFEMDCSEHAPSLSTSEFFYSDKIMYPNPTNGPIYLSTEFSGKPYQILTIDGRIIQKGITEEKLDLSNFKNGTYLLQIEMEKTQILLKID
jgi:predicted dienelactone hydrolase